MSDVADTTRRAVGAPTCMKAARLRRAQQAAAHRAKERRRVERLALASDMPQDLRRADTLTLLSRLKMTYVHLWASSVMRHPKTQPDLSQGPRANIRQNNRLHRLRTQAFTKAVEAHLIDKGRLLPDDVLGGQA